MSDIYIGVMTGTSMDGVDIVAASFDPLQLHATLTVPFDPDLQDQLMALTLPDDNEIDRMGKADVALASMIGHGINQLIEKIRSIAVKSKPLVHMGKPFVIVPNTVLPCRLAIPILLPN
jgi:1,6-anhydro-N-acetylmuramate kinase